MGRNRATSIASTRSGETTTQELGSMYDYLAKTVLLGPSGAGKSVPPQCLEPRAWAVAVLVGPLG